MTNPLYGDKEKIELGALEDEKDEKKDPTKKGFREALRHAFSTEGEEDEFNDDDIKLIERVANEIVKRQMASPALLFLESIKPLSFFGSQTMYFVRPFLIAAIQGNSANYDRFALLMERRRGMEIFIEKIECFEDDRLKKEREKKE